MIRLSARLAAVASLLVGGDKTVDVGTDHAYLPVYLIQTGKCSRVLASDIGALPLENARKTILRFGLEEKISLRISNGLEKILPEEADEICICGMGGTLISDILTAAAWVPSKGRHLVLQPMTHSEDVRKYLCENGFHIDRELCVSDSDRRVYCCISAVWTGEQADCDPGFYYFGNLIGREGAAEQYTEKQINRVKTRCSALMKADRYPEEACLLRRVIAYYNEKRELV